MKLTEGKTNSMLLTFGFLAFACFVVTRQYCTTQMPEAVRPEIGRTIAFEANYGKTVYLTVPESHYVHVAYGTAMALGAVACAVVLLRSWQMFREGLHEKNLTKS
jgi:hypothetical protein